MTPFAVKHLASGGVITNYHCVSQCGHCLYNCGPHRPKDYLDVSMAEKTFRSIMQRGAYLNHCDLCDEIRGALIRAAGDRFRELAPAGHYNGR